MTEDLLLALIEHDATETTVYKASVPDESAFGPDWLWAINTGGEWLTMWVQAKKASGSTLLSYGGLSGAVNQEQALRLLLNARNQGAVAVYAFFNPAGPPFGLGTPNVFGACTRHVLTVAATGLPWNSSCTPAGVTMADAVEVAQNAIFGELPGRRHASSINSYAMPWECLVCPQRILVDEARTDAPGAQGGGPAPDDGATPLVPRLRPAIEYLVLGRLGPSGVRDGPRPLGITVEAPDWVIRMRERRSPFDEEVDLSDRVALPAYFVVTVDLAQQ